MARRVLSVMSAVMVRPREALELAAEGREDRELIVIARTAGTKRAERVC